MKSLNFKYKNDHYLNIISIVLFVVFIAFILLILKYVDTIFYKVLYVLLLFIITNILITIIGKAISITTGRFTFDKHSFVYETLDNEYTINYKEIDYIQKDVYMDNDDFFKHENYIYKIKIKDAGFFAFKYCDDTLIDALNELANNCEIKIVD